MSLRLFSVVLLALPVAAFAGERKVLLIGIDGCRPDAIEKAETPNLDRLVAGGVMSTNTSILGPREAGNDTISGPGWSSIYTGVWADKHGVMDNEFVGKNYGRYPHFFSLLKQARPEAETASFAAWGPIHEHILSGATVTGGDAEEGKGPEAWAAADVRVTEAAVKYLREGDPDAVCVYLGQVDETGHAKGFHPTVPEYVAAIERADAHVGELLRAINGRPTVKEEEWLVIVTTDHGGQGTGHGDGHKVEEIRRVFLIVSGPGVKDPGAERQTYLVDAVPTALVWLGVEIDPRWELDGTAFGVGSVEEVGGRRASRAAGGGAQRFVGGAAVRRGARGDRLAGRSLRRGSVVSGCGGRRSIPCLRRDGRNGKRVSPSRPGSGRPCVTSPARGSCGRGARRGAGGSAASCGRKGACLELTPST